MVVVATATAHSLVTTLATWVQSSSLSAAVVMAVVVVLVADVVGLTGVVILLQRVGDGGVDG